MMAIAGLFGLPLMQFVPVIARDMLNNPGDTADIVAARNSILIAVIGIGAVITAVLLSMNRSIKRSARILIGGQTVFVIALVGLSFSRNLVHAVPMMIAYGAGFVSQMTITNTTIQLVVPDSIRGRVPQCLHLGQPIHSPIWSLIDRLDDPTNGSIHSIFNSWRNLCDWFYCPEINLPYRPFFRY